MNIQLFFTLYALSVPVFFVIDMIWLGFIAKDFYQKTIGHLLGDVKWGVAILFYLLFLLGLTFFATYAGVQAGSWKMAAVYGALFGFFTYLTYDLTNLATLKDWPVSVVYVDILWGSLLGALVAGAVAATYLTYN